MEPPSEDPHLIFHVGNLILRTVCPSSPNVCLYFLRKRRLGWRGTWLMWQEWPDEQHLVSVFMQSDFSYPLKITVFLSWAALVLAIFILLRRWQPERWHNLGGSGLHEESCFCCNFLTHLWHLGVLGSSWQWVSSFWNFWPLSSLVILSLTLCQIETHVAHFSSISFLFSCSVVLDSCSPPGFLSFTICQSLLKLTSIE